MPTPPHTTTSLPHLTSDENAERLQEKIKEIALKEQERLTEARAAAAGLGYINLRGFPIGVETLGLIPAAIASAHRVICFFASGKEIRLGAVDPSDAAVIALAEQLGTEHRAHVQLYLISVYSFQWAQRQYANIPEHHAQVAGVEIRADAVARFRDQMKTIQDLQAHMQQLSVTDVLTGVLAGALELGASDVHLEAEEHDVKIRFRIDGALQTVATISKEALPKLINRIKLLAGLKLNVSTQPQDGRTTLYLDRDTVDVRISTLPSAFGESVVMRLLMSAASSRTFDQLGLRGAAHHVLSAQIQRPNGMIITTGPTSSGKTTTLYAILNALNTTERKIITLEDPIEYRIAGISQSQVDPSRDYTFAKGLKAILRQNPDMVMVGEIRDSETAQIAIHAALTGHLVLSSLHTNNAAGAVPRFLAMGVVPYLLTPALNAVIAQRLVRTICLSCKEETQLDAPTLARVRQTLAAISPASGEKADQGALHFFRGRGCAACHGIGLKGRTGIFEIFTMNEEIEKVILSSQVSEHTMQEIAIKHGMVLMAQDGLLKALDGITTVEEVFRVAR